MKQISSYTPPSILGLNMFLKRWLSYHVITKFLPPVREHKTYLLDGELLPWEGAVAEVLSPILPETRFGNYQSWSLAGFRS